MIIIGLTGSIGMGKSETAKMFAAHGIPVFDADAVVRTAQGKSGESLPLIEEAFPGTVADGVLDRAALGAQVFGNEAALKKLERIMHPIVQKARKKFFELVDKNNTKIVILDVPLLFEAGGEKGCDVTVVVSAPTEVQQARVLSRTHMTQEKFEDIIARQMPDSEKRERADYVIETDQGLEAADRAVSNIIKDISSKNPHAFEGFWRERLQDA